MLDNESNSMEGDVLNIFLELIGCLSITQNVLINNKEIIYEEMKAFFNKAFFIQL